NVPFQAMKEVIATTIEPPKRHPSSNPGLQSGFGLDHRSALLSQAMNSRDLVGEISIKSPKNAPKPHTVM
ncbi:MAG: hypothetical protein ACRD35_09890, partial [Candidatus Acidiferrales bacterium]